MIINTSNNNNNNNPKFQNLNPEQNDGEPCAKQALQDYQINANVVNKERSGS